MSIDWHSYYKCRGFISFYDKRVISWSVVGDNAESCWYSVNGGMTNSSLVMAGTNWTGLSSNEGSNTWIVYCNDSDGNLGTCSDAPDGSGVCTCG